MSTYGKIHTVAEIGLNYAWGDDIGKFVDNAKRLIRIAAVAGCDYVKFQKRNPEVAVPASKRDEEKRVPWRSSPTTYLQYKKDIEFSKDVYIHLADYAADQGIGSFASVWDIDSAREMSDVFSIAKIPSAKLTDTELLDEVNSLYDFRILSTGMSTEDEIDLAVNHLNPSVIMHTNSVYPTPVHDLKLGYLQWLQDKYSACDIGYSNHYYGAKAIYVALGMGANWIEFHITEDHTLWGSDQAASIEPHGVFEITKAIRDFENAIADGYGPRSVFPGEDKKRKALRG